MALNNQCSWRNNAKVYWPKRPVESTAARHSRAECRNLLHNFIVSTSYAPCCLILIGLFDPDLDDDDDDDDDYCCYFLFSSL